MSDDDTMVLRLTVREFREHMQAMADKAYAAGETAGRAFRTGPRFGVARRPLVLSTLAAANGNVSEAARRLGVARSTIYADLRAAG